MRRFLAAQFAPVLRAWRNGYEAEVRRAAIAFFLLVFLAFGVCLAVPELRLGFSAYLQHLFQGMDLTDGAGNLSPLLLLANNLRACAVTLLYGADPLCASPGPGAGRERGAAGRPRRLLCRHGHHHAAVCRQPAAPRDFRAARLDPGLFHGAVHLRAPDRCRRDPAALPLGACLGLAARLLVFLLLPLLILAALTEAYVTPLAAGLFL